MGEAQGRCFHAVLQFLKPMQSNAACYRQDNLSLIYDSALLAEPPISLFEASAHKPEASNSSGRGTVVFFRHGELNLVLKHYHRGGLPGRLIRNSYLYLGAGKSRMWQEFHLLQTMHNLGLPVPRPLAASCIRSSLLTCQGALISERIEQAATLNELLKQRSLPPAVWQKIGACLARFHKHQVYHADLNADNIMLNTADEVFLIDFDKGGLRQHGSKRWQQQNLARLLRSLHKQQGRNAGYHFSEADWQSLLQAYRSSSAGL